MLDIVLNIVRYLMTYIDNIIILGMFSFVWLFHKWNLKKKQDIIVKYTKKKYLFEVTIYFIVIREIVKRNFSEFEKKLNKVCTVFDMNRFLKLAICQIYF